MAIMVPDPNLKKIEECLGIPEDHQGWYLSVDYPMNRAKVSYYTKNKPRREYIYFQPQDTKIEKIANYIKVPDETSSWTLIALLDEVVEVELTRFAIFDEDFEVE